MKKILILFLFAFLAFGSGFAQKSEYKVTTKKFWSNWYVQTGLDMSLQNPYGKDFSHVFPKGKTFGLDVSVGKWFSPEICIRVRLNWENGLSLFKNDHLEWLAKGDYESNLNGGGYIAVYIDPQLSLTNIIAGYIDSRKLNIFIFPRAGLLSNRAIKSANPTVGVGWGVTYRLKDKWSIYGDMAYQVTTSEFYQGVSRTGMDVSTGSNGFFSFHIGVQYNLGKTRGFVQKIY